jgi:general stress protein YciG
MVKGVSEFCGDSHRCSPKNHPQSIMDYFELYYAYLAWCEKDNWANYRDPNHDFMEWNHTLPQCIFGDQPIGQWLTIEQHAIASCLQTLAFQTLCHCGWHKKHVPENLWVLACEEVLTERKNHATEIGRKYGPSVGAKLYEEGKGLFNPDYKELKSEWCKKGVETQREIGVGIHDSERRKEWIDIYTENNRKNGHTSFENKTALFDKKYDGLRKEWASNAGKVGGKVTGAKVVELKIGILDPANADRVKEGQRKGRETTNKQKWMSTLDGFISTAAGVASHNRSIGGSGKDKIKLQDS